MPLSLEWKECAVSVLALPKLSEVIMIKGGDPTLFSALVESIRLGTSAGVRGNSTGGDMGRLISGGVARAV